MKPKKVHAYLFIFPSLFLTLVFGVYPLIWALRYMFYDYQGIGTPVFIGLGNFARIMRDTQFWSAVGNTGVYALGKLVVTIPLALTLAIILNRKWRGRSLLRAVYYLPTIFSASVMAIVFFIIFNSYNGILNQLLVKYHVISAPIGWLDADHAMMTTIIIAIWGAVGNYMLLFIAGLQSIPEELYEAASLDGANEFQKLRNVTIPLLGPVLQMIIMLAITTALKGYESIMVLTEGGPYGKTEVMYLYLFKLLFPISADTQSLQQLGYGSAVGFTTAIIVGAVTLIYFWISKKLNDVY
ncbi:MULTISPECIES: carbohydrate ABC transporter permease [Paenibacillus]|uniref:ABC-type sugar transport system permease subunit n=2 Tax=Paenibacillus TaxID=44249 RepID=A0AAP5H2B1_PAEAM|nr:MULTISPECIES: sugar ABC transporter permease [Paenibacillus]KQY83841.1 sugar ABC transporter permease [Paenibacillus sp. Root52]MCG7377237.1 sugar ABC transporter permease [Paenibacillus sp. ACRSA]MDQ0170891.1 ABC-type sugar transport system permease subunit [Paenibacillus tundrae]MDR6722641.1 ABC-type sugar transport system permease subunit [Paenibacillus amylolyticus]